MIHLNHTTMAVVIPFRDRGVDPLRKANLVRVLQQYDDYGFCVEVVDDGRKDHAQFNRSAAYNRGVARRGDDTKVFVFAESDMLLPAEQIIDAAKMALESPGLVIPFTEYHYVDPVSSEDLRQNGYDCSKSKAWWTMDDGRSIGAVNVVSRQTLNLIGRYDEMFEGNWYDDDAMKLAFEKAAGETRWVNGPAWHLYHLPGYRGDHLSDADKAATERNRQRLNLYREADSVARVRFLTAGHS